MDGLLGLLRCPECGDELRLDAASKEEGLLKSACGLWFPVVNGIPRVFVGEMRRVYQTDFADFVARHALSTELGADLSAQTRAKLATRDSFGYEWTHFHQMLPEWEQNAHYYFEPLGGAESLRGQLVLDGGCGKGRHTYYSLRAGARVVAVDFSRAVDVAQSNCSKVDGERLFVQADLMSLPFAASTFDLAYSFGVLHHLPDPEAGFRSVVSRVRPGGRVLVYLYHALEGEPVKQAILRGVNWARTISTRLPHRVLLPLTTVLGVGLYYGVVGPYRVLSKFGPTKQFAESLPLKSYAAYPIHVIINDQFDRFSAPIENRYRRDEVEGWFARAGLGETTVLGGAGWRAAGVRAAR